MNPYYTHTANVPPPVTRAISSSIRAELDLVQAGFDAVQSAVAAAAGYSSVPAFDATVAYTNGFVVFSNVDKQLYRRNSAGTSATDPSADPINWTRVVIGLNRVEVLTTTRAALAGNDYWLENVAATTVTAPTAVDGSRFKVTPANGLTGALANTIDFGAAVVRGPAKTMTGILTLTLGAPMEFMYSSTLAQWVVQ